MEKKRKAYPRKKRADLKENILKVISENGGDNNFIEIDIMDFLFKDYIITEVLDKVKELKKQKKIETKMIMQGRVEYKIK